MRVNSGVHASTHDYLATAHEDQKFGIPLAEAPDVAAAIRAEDSLELLGLHSHIGSQIFERTGSSSPHAGCSPCTRSSWRAARSRAQPRRRVRHRLHDGRRPDPGRARSPSEFAEIVAAECARLGIPVPIVAVEPGRSIIGTAGVTLYEVGTIKDVAGRRHSASAATSASTAA